MFRLTQRRLTVRNNIQPSWHVSVNRRVAGSRPRAVRSRSSTPSPTRARSGRTSSPGGRAFPRAPSRASSARSRRPAWSSKTPSRAVTTSGSVLSVSQTPCSHASTCACRATAPRGARARHRRDGDASRPRRGGRCHHRLRAERALHPARDAARAPVDRARHVGREGDARVHRPPAPPPPAPCLHALGRSQAARSSPPRSSASARRATPMHSRSASPASPQ